jgi:hypothetical protein
MVSSAKKCAVLVPYGNRIEHECEESLRNLERRGYVVRRVPGFAAIDQARSQLATTALADGFEEIMWIDSDIGFDPDSVDALRRLDRPLVAGLYAKKGRREVASSLLEKKDLTFGRQGGVMEIRYAATGFLFTRREVYDKIRKTCRLPECNKQFGVVSVPYFLPMILETPEGPWYLGEDFAFSERARQAGFSILADTRIRLWHIGNYAYSWEDAGVVLRRFDTYIIRDKKPEDEPEKT